MRVALEYHRRKLWIAAVAVCTVLLYYLVELPVWPAWSQWAVPLSGKVIALDAGHGGADGGAVGRNGLIEKDLNMAIALYLRDYLQEAGALVLLTREGDHDLALPDTKGYSKRKTEDLKKRAERVAQSKVDLAISIHMNSMPQSRWSGAQTFYSDANPNNERLAAIVQSALRDVLGNTDRVAKKIDTLYLLKNFTMPGVLIEVGFLSNPGEANLLADEQYQRKVAGAIYHGILRYAAGEQQ